MKKLSVLTFLFCSMVLTVSAQTKTATKNPNKKSYSELDFQNKKTTTPKTYNTTAKPRVRPATTQDDELIISKGAVENNVTTTTEENVNLGVSYDNNTTTTTTTTTDYPETTPTYYQEPTYISTDVTTDNNTYTTSTPEVKKPLGFTTMTFEMGLKEFDLGKMQMGEQRSHIFEFINTGNEPLEIDLVTACECVTLDWSRYAIQPNQRGFIQATFNSNAVYPEGINQDLEKDLTIVLKNTTANGYPIVEEAKLKMYVEAAAIRSDFQSTITTEGGN